MEKVLKRKKFSLDGRDCEIKVVQEGKKKAVALVDVGSGVFSCRAPKLTSLSALFADFAASLESKDGGC